MTVTAQLPACVGALLLAAVAGGSAAAQHHDSHDARALREDPRLAPGQLAPELAGLGDHHFAITTESERAQRFFDQGLRLTYGFNHQEALRAFKEAARLDPGCAMAYWGWALVLGPNLNLPMRPSVVAQGRNDEAAVTLERFHTAWSAADMQLESSRHRGARTRSE